jgi:multisubunit Na+/H+ antiporter MnhB subunit
VSLSLILIACALVALTVATHTIGLVVLLARFAKVRSSPPTRFWSITWMLIRIVWALILIHAIEITLWALFYLGDRCFPDGPAAFYFSGVTYTTLGYGDLLLPLRWRLLAPIEALTGILMGGLSTGLFFVVVSTILLIKSRDKTEPS